jgi:hypothetical protein
LWIVERVVVQRRRSNASSGKGVLVSLRETFAWLRHISRSSISITPGRKRGSDCARTGLTASISTASPSARSSLDALTRLQAVTGRHSRRDGRGFQGVEQGLDSEVRSRRKALHGCAAVGAAGVV